MICSVCCTVTGCHAVLSFQTSLLPHPLQLSGGHSLPLVQFHKDITTTRMRLNVNADTTSKCSNMDYNIATQYMLAWYINSWSIIGLLLFIHSLYNQADVCRANHHPVYETKVRAKRKLQKSELVWTRPTAHCCPLPHWQRYLPLQDHLPP